MNYKQRLQHLQQILSQFEVDGLILSDPFDLLYFAGIHVSSGNLFVSAADACLFVDGRYEQAAKEKSPLPVSICKSLQECVSSIAERCRQLRRLGCDGDALSWNDATHLQQLAASKGMELVRLACPSRSLRMIKDVEEIAKMRAAVALADEGYFHLLSVLREGITEIEAAFSLEAFFRSKGAKGVSFESIVAFGPHSAMPHYRPQHAPLKAGQTVLLDFGCLLDDYCSDMTRVVFWKECCEEMRQVYAHVLEAQRIAIDQCQPGKTTLDLDRLSRQYISDAGFGAAFNHSLGHGIGLQVHEWPSFRQPIALQPGMVITIEPGIYLPGIGGVRIEDILLITAKGAEVLNKAPKCLTVL